MRCTVLLAMCILLGAGPVLAQDAVPVALTYSAPSSCPTQGRFVTRLRMHTQRVLFSNAPDALTLRVAIVRSAAGFTGTLEVAQAGRPPGTRSFEAVDCPDVVWALALSAALSIDPEASLTVTSEDEPADVQGTPSEPGRTSATSDSERAASGETTSGATSRSGAVATDAANEPAFVPGGPLPEDAGGAPLWSIGPAITTSFAFDPKAAVGGGVMAAVRDTSGRHLLPLELAIRLEYLGTRWTRGSDPLLLDWWTANLLACPLRAGAGLTILVCGAGQVGVIHVEGVDVEQTQAVSRSFFSVGLALWARHTLSDHWELTGVADLKLPLVDRSFALGPERDVVSSSRPLGASVTLGTVYGF